MHISWRAFQLLWLLSRRSGFPDLFGKVFLITFKYLLISGVYISRPPTLVPNLYLPALAPNLYFPALAPTSCLPALAPNLYLPVLAPTLCLPQICIYRLRLGLEFAYTDLVSPICIYWPWPTICTQTGCQVDLPTMMLNNLINSIIVYRSKYWSCTEQNVFFKITALHNCQLELRPRPNNLCIENVALQLATIKKKEILR